MFGIKYFKGSPSAYYLHYSMGRLRRKGTGLSFWYLAPASSLVAVPLQGTDAPFGFALPSKDFQDVTVQGQLTYRIADPDKLAGLMNYTISPSHAYLTDDPDTLPDRVMGVVKTMARSVIEGLDLKLALNSSDLLQSQIFARAKEEPLIQMLGIELLGLVVHSVRPSPEMGRALEAEAREALQRASDEAIYLRRNASVEQERKIRENELRTEVAVEEKKRQIRETKLAADISIEKQRETLITKKAENDRKEADTHAYALEASLKPIRGMDWKILMAAREGSLDPRTMIALAFREMAENAGKIGELNVSPDLLNSLLKADPARK